MSMCDEVLERLVPGTVGRAEVRIDEVSSMDALQDAIGGGHHSGLLREGARHARLLIGGHLVMAATPMEARTNREFVSRARGRVLIGGLGLGMVVHPILRKPEVEHVTIVEIDSDVVALVGPSVEAAGRVRIVQADVREWRPARGVKFDTIYYDIWPAFCADNLKEMSTLKRLARSYRAKGSYLACWGERECRDLARRPW